MSEGHTPAPEELRQNLTRVYLKTVEEGRYGLFQRVTRNNKERIEKLLDEKPIFYESRENAREQMEIDPGIEQYLPEVFFENPTAWIEAQPNINEEHQTDYQKELQKTRRIGDIMGFLDDVDDNRVKHITLVGEDGTSVKIVSKRLNPKKKDFTEVENAKAAYANGIPTPKVVAKISHHGNMYAWFEYVPSVDLARLDVLLGDPRVVSEEQLFERVKYFDAKLSDDDKIKIEYEKSEMKRISQLKDFWDEHAGKIICDIETKITKKYRKNIEQLQRGEFTVQEAEIIMQEIKRKLEASLHDGEWMDTLRASDNRIPTLQELINIAGTQMARNILRLNGHYFLLYETIETIKERLKQIFPDVKYRSLPDYSGYGCMSKIAEILRKITIRENSLFAESDQFIEFVKQKGVNRNQLKNRNILLQWDEKKKEPLRDEHGKLQFILIDFETPRQSFEEKRRKRKHKK